MKKGEVFKGKSMIIGAKIYYDQHKNTVTAVFAAVVIIIALLASGRMDSLLPGKQLTKEDMNKKIAQNRELAEKNSKGENQQSGKNGGGKNPGNKDQTASNSDSGQIYVDISGAVRAPGVYIMKEGDRLNDVIQRAGGLKKSADIDAINRVEVIQDGDKLYIPKRGEAGPVQTGGRIPSNKNQSSQGEIVDLNRADISDLQKIKGVGPSTAENIINYRQQNGRFTSKEELKNVSGIGEKTYDKIKDMITI